MKIKLFANLQEQSDQSDSDGRVQFVNMDWQVSASTILATAALLAQISSGKCTFTYIYNLCDFKF